MSGLEGFIVALIAFTILLFGLGLGIVIGSAGRDGE